MVRSFDLRRAGAFPAIFGGVLGLLYAPFHAAAYLATEDGSPPIVPWDGPFRDLFPTAFAFDDAQAVYIAYGHFAAFVMLGLFVGLLALHRLQGTTLGRKGTFAFRFLASAHALLVVGTAVEYYTPYLEQAFLFAGPAILGVIGGSVWYGILTLKARVIPRGAAWLLTIGGPAMFPMIALFGHIPLAMSFLYVAWIWIGVTLAASRSAATTSARAPPVAQ